MTSHRDLRVPSLPEHSGADVLARRDTLVRALLADELVADEQVEAWCYERAFSGPRTWSAVLPYLLAGLWLEMLGLLLALNCRRLRALVGIDRMLYLPQPYVLVALTDQRLLMTRFEVGGLPGEAGVRAVGPSASASAASELRLSRVLRGWLLELKGAPDSAVMVRRGLGSGADPHSRRGSELCAALEQRGWVEPAG